MAIDNAAIAVRQSQDPDFNGDGFTDILWRNSMTGENGFWQMNGSTLIQGVILDPAPVNSGWKIVGKADFTQDGQPDILWRNTITGDNGFWEMNGAAFVKAVSLAPVAASSGWEIVGVGDLTNDGSSDIVWSNTVTGANGFWRMNGSTFVDAQEVESLPPSSGWRISGVGDFNNDGYADLLWRNSLTGDNGIWRMNGSTRIGIDVLPGSSPAAGWNMV